MASKAKNTLYLLPNKFSVRQQEILNTSAILFRERGYKDVSVRDIASSLGIKASSLYNHFNGKEEILESLIFFMVHEFSHGITAIINNKLPDVQCLEKIIELHVNLAKTYPNHMACLNQDWSYLTHQKNFFLSQRDAYEWQLKKVIASGIKNKEIIDENVEVILYTLLATLRYLHLWILRHEKTSIKKLTKSLVNIFIKGIKVV